MSSQTVSRVDQWNKNEKLADDQAKRLNSLRFPEKFCSVFRNYQSSDALKATLEFTAESDGIPLLPVVPISLLQRRKLEVILQRAFHLPVKIDANVDQLEDGEGALVHARPYHILDVNIPNPPKICLPSEVKKRVPAGRRLLTLSELVALTLQYPEYLEDCGFYAGGSAFCAKSGMAYASVRGRQEGGYKFVEVVYTIPLVELQFCWPTCRIKVVQ